ncbi:MAG: tryptophan--tRNA ligase [Candidatus Parcubacteria bacterium]|nr:tryptophan--tRNA ligase [Candidatus Paceibacterota bacterium]
MTNILTGLQATGTLHIGNYFGSIKQLVQKSNTLRPEDNLYLFVPDLHSLTADIDHAKFYDAVLDNIRIYLASGLDTTKPNICTFRQSRVPAHTQMQWFLSCYSYFGQISKMTQFKDKSSDNNQNINVGLFTYPILMAGDIFLYDAEYVPVGYDQTQHLELARDLAIRFNNKFDQPVLTVPKSTKDQNIYFGMDKPLNILSLTNPLNKMSKSSTDLSSKILLTDSPQIATKKIMSATTDSLELINWDWDNQPGITNLLQILSLVTDTPTAQIIDKWRGQTRYGDLKKEVAFSIGQFLTEFQIKYKAVTDEVILQAVAKGEVIANLQAEIVLTRVKKVLGLIK